MTIPPTPTEQIHATCVAVDGIGVLIRGPSGSGKSDLALRLIDGGAELVSDDRVDLTRTDGSLSAAPPAPLAGLMEVRGMGIMQRGFVDRANVRVVIDLRPTAEIERLPEPAEAEVCGVRLMVFHIDPFTVSAVAKVRLAVNMVSGSIIRTND